MDHKEKPITGTYQGSAKGFGFVIPDVPTGGGDWFVPRGQELNAWDGDAVTLLPTDPARRAGRVTAVTRRANGVVTGTLHREGKTYFLTPDRERLSAPILLTGRVKNVSPGFKAAVAVTNFGTANTPAMGSLREVFGPGYSRQTTQAAILYHYDVHQDFPPEVAAAADALPQAVSPAEMAGRMDFRAETVVTIDSESAKDLDDAVSLTYDAQGRRVLGVHIADVSHYVPPKSPLDLEAYERGTSVYYVNQVAPMLPTPLSNGICSLNPQVDRLTLSCLMTLDEEGRVVDHTLCQGVIRTVGRLSYKEVNALLAGEPVETGPMAEGEPHTGPVRALVSTLDALARQRLALRRRRGALELTSTECCFILDGEGHPVDIQRVQSGRGESLIEECMLLANETVAKHLCDNHCPALFRVHEKPSSDKAEGLKTMVAPLGYDLKDADGFHLQKLLHHFKDTPMAGAVNMMVLRSLMKAKYDPENLGHFGLAADHYCHFTSPIRRYPDLVVHRVLTALLTGRSLKPFVGFMPAAARQSSEREVAAQNAEREIEKLYMAEFMEDKVGQTFSATVTGVTKFGVFVGLDAGVEGLLPVEALPRDQYLCDDPGMTLRGTHTGLTLSFGSPVEVVLAAADPSTGKIDFSWPGEGIPSGINVQTTHRLDTRRRRASCSKKLCGSSRGRPRRRSGRS